MLELFGWNFGMTLLAGILLVVGALALGAIAQYVGQVRIGYEWVFTAAAALVGGWLGSEAFGTLSTWGPVFDDLYILPALIGGFIVGGVVDFVVRRYTGGVYFEPRPI